MNKQIIGDKTNPFHLSVGFVVREGDKVYIVKHPREGYKFPSETVYLNESLMSAVKRGAREELGIEVEVVKYLGFVNTTFTRQDNIPIEKCTLFFESEYVSTVEKSLEEDEVEQTVEKLSLEEIREILTNSRPEELKIISALQS